MCVKSFDFNYIAYMFRSGVITQYFFKSSLLISLYFPLCSALLTACKCFFYSIYSFHDGLNKSQVEKIMSS